MHKPWKHKKIFQGRVSKGFDLVQSSDDDIDAAIRLQGISHSYDNEPFIENLDLAIPRGRITSIIGPNGCGKSTLLKIVDGILVPQSGQAFIAGIPTLSMSGRERARCLALLIQGAQAPPMTVEALVHCGRYPYQGHLHQASEEDRHCVEEAMLRAGIEAFRDHDVRYLSGGERQRAFIAMTIAQNTDIIALDEPTTYLDVKACHEIMMLACELNREASKTIVMVIHDLDLALRYSDYLIVMKRGQCLCAGNRGEVLSSRAIEQAFQVEIREARFDERAAFISFPL